MNWCAWYLWAACTGEMILLILVCFFCSSKIATVTTEMRKDERLNMTKSGYKNLPPKMVIKFTKLPIYGRSLPHLFHCILWQICTHIKFTSRDFAITFSVVSKRSLSICIALWKKIRNIRSYIMGRIVIFLTRLTLSCISKITVFKSKTSSIWVRGNDSVFSTVEINFSKYVFRTFLISRFEGMRSFSSALVTSVCFNIFLTDVLVDDYLTCLSTWTTRTTWLVRDKLLFRFAFMVIIGVFLKFKRIKIWIQLCAVRKKTFRVHTIILVIVPQRKKLSV